MRARSFFSFPNPVNDVAARTVATGVVAMASVAIATSWWWLTIPLAFGFVARVAAGPRLSPLGLVATRVVAPVLGRDARRVPGPPKRFAQAIGAAFTLAALSAWLAGAPVVTEALLAALLVPATLEAAFGYCVGCKLFGVLMAAGLVPVEVCEACDNLLGTATAARRAAA